MGSFFFQAEDGIRDLTVTGVQTCALPIYLRIGVVAELPGFVQWCRHRPTSDALPPCLRKNCGVVELNRRNRCQKVARSEEHTSELQSQSNLVCRLLLEKKKKKNKQSTK